MTDIKKDLELIKKDLKKDMSLEKRLLYLKKLELNKRKIDEKALDGNTIILMWQVLIGFLFILQLFLLIVGVFLSNKFLILIAGIITVISSLCSKKFENGLFDIENKKVYNAKEERYLNEIEIYKRILLDDLRYSLNYDEEILVIINAYINGKINVIPEYLKEEVKTILNQNLNNSSFDLEDQYKITSDNIKTQELKLVLKKD